MKPEDVSTLRQMPFGMAREYERALHAEARSDFAFMVHTSVLPFGALEHVQGVRAARFQFGTGGGRKAHQESHDHLA